MTASELCYNCCTDLRSYFLEGSKYSHYDFASLNLRLSYCFYVVVTY